MLQGNSVRFFHYTLKSSKQKEDPEANLNSAFFLYENQFAMFL